MVVFTVEKIATELLEALLLVFTYIIPLFSTIRAIHNQEKSSFQQWLTYWLLINVINPFFRFFRFHPLIHLLTVLYLSLPKFQGALHIYHELIEFDSVIERYGVEDKVDGQIKHVKKSLKNALWNIAKDIGWGTLSQIGEIVTLFQTADTKETGSEYDRNGQSSNEEERASLVNESDTIDDDTGDFAASKDPISQAVVDSESSVDTNSEEAEYLEDFVNMLRKGLYVFAYHTVTKNAEECNTDEEKKFRLRNLCFQSNANTGEDNYGDYFVLHPVESKSSSNDDESFLLPLSSVDEVRRSGISGIQFLSIKSPQVSPSNSISDFTTCDHSVVTSASMVTINSFKSIHKDNANTEKKEADDSEEVILMEILLSEESDCSTMLKGFQLFVANLKSNDSRDYDEKEEKLHKDALVEKKSRSGDGGTPSYSDAESQRQPTANDMVSTEDDKNIPAELSRDTSSNCVFTGTKHTPLDTKSEPKREDDSGQSFNGNGSFIMGDENEPPNEEYHENKLFSDENDYLGDQSCDVVDWSMSTPKRNNETSHDYKLASERNDYTDGQDTNLGYSALPDE